MSRKAELCPYIGDHWLNITWSWLINEQLNWHRSQYFIKNVAMLFSPTQMTMEPKKSKISGVQRKADGFHFLKIEGTWKWAAWCCSPRQQPEEISMIQCGKRMAEDTPECWCLPSSNVDLKSYNTIHLIWHLFKKELTDACWTVNVSNLLCAQVKGHRQLVSQDVSPWVETWLQY